MGLFAVIFLLSAAGAHAAGKDYELVPDPLKGPESADSSEKKYRRIAHNARAMLQLAEEKQRDKAGGRSEFQQALDLAHDALDLKSDGWEASVVAGLAKVRLGDQGEGLADLDSILESVPDPYHAGLAKKVSQIKGSQAQPLLNPFVIPEKVYPAK